MFFCISCGSDFEARKKTTLCPACYSPTVVGEPARIEPVPLVDVEAATPRAKYADDARSCVARLLGATHDGSVVVVWGMPGTGKSTDALAWLCDFRAVRPGPLAYVTNELVPSQVAEIAARWGLDGRGVGIVETASPVAAATHAMAQGAVAVVVDSVSMHGSTHEVVRRLRQVIAAARARGVSVVAISHATRSNAPALPLTAIHEIDAAIVIRQNFARIDKKIRFSVAAWQVSSPWFRAPDPND